MSEDIHEIEKEIETELSRISISTLEADDPDTEASEAALSDSETISDDLSESDLSYLNFIKARNQDAEKFILQDLEDKETTSNIYGVVSCRTSAYLAELASEYNEDPEQLKRRVQLEIENEDLQIATAPSSDSQHTSKETITSDHFITADVDMNVAVTHLEAEEKCRQEFEDWEKRQKELEDEKRKKWKAEREAQEKQNEEEHARRVQRQEEFEAERIKLELLHKKHQIAIEDELQKEKKAWRDKMMQHEELITKLQLQMEEEKKASEEQKAKERQRLAEQQNAAAVKIQARFRSFLAHKKYSVALKEWKDGIKKKQKLLEEIKREMEGKEEKIKRQMEEKKQKKDEEKKRQEKLEREEYLEKVRQCEDYEKKKESLKLGREKQLQIRRKEQREPEVKRAKAVMSESGENNKENMKKDKPTESTEVIREQQKGPNKPVEEQNQTEITDETNRLVTAERNSTPTPNTLGSGKKEHSSRVNNENIGINSLPHVEENSLHTRDLHKASNSHASNYQSVDLGANDIVEAKANNVCSSAPNVQTNASKREGENQFSQSETMKKTVFLMENADGEVRETWDTIQDVAECSSRTILLDDTERKRINWMNTHKSWSKIHEKNQSKQTAIKKRPRKRSVSKVPPISAQTIIQSGSWSTLQQVTTLTLEDLPACSLSTLSECLNLQFLTLRRCGLVTLEGLSSCKYLKYINVEENNIQIIDCEHLGNLCILILNKNHLSSVCGLDGCINLQNLELSYNRITRIGGLESLKNLQQLIVDHNRLISTKGLCEAPTLIHLDCSFNHLSQVEDIENCGLLQVLKVQGNYLQELPSLENHVLLRELYLDDNSISTIMMLSSCWLPLLQILSLSQNRLTELVPLESFVSLEKLDVKSNCLSDLRGVVTCLSGCHKLRELSLSGNPLLQERNWRPSLCEHLPSLQFLDGEVNCQYSPRTGRSKGTESRTFLELCQVQIEENVLLKQKAAELGAASALDSAQGHCWYFSQLIELSVKHRYTHERGELDVTDRDGPEALQSHLEQTSPGCLQENNLFITGATENKQVLLGPSERWITPGHSHAAFINSSVPVQQKENKADQRVKQESAESRVNYGKESKNVSAKLTLEQSVIASDTGGDAQRPESDAQRLHGAASPIQSLRQQYHARKKTERTKTENHQFTEALRQKHKAATLIQAFWKGFVLRKKLAGALAAVESDDVEDDYDEIDVDDFTFSQAALEKEWLTLDSTHFPSKTLLLSNQLSWPKCSRLPESGEHSSSLLLSSQDVCQSAARPPSCSGENIHLHSKSGKETVSEVSDWKKEKKFSSKSEKEEKISEEWGFKDTGTAQLLLKRAQKMKPKKYCSKNSDPAVRLALFKNNENKYLHVKPPKKTQPASHFEGKERKKSKQTHARPFSHNEQTLIQSHEETVLVSTQRAERSTHGKAEESIWNPGEGESEESLQLDPALEEKLQRREDFTCQWLHSRILGDETIGSRNLLCSHLLPELNPAGRDRRQVQLAASPGSREDTDSDLVSMAGGSALSENRGKNEQPRRHPARSSRTTRSTPETSRLGASRTERISFRDHPVQLSGGWGAGRRQATSSKR